MVRLIAVMTISGLLVAGCATTPSGMDDESMMSTMAPAPDPALPNTDRDSDTGMGQGGGEDSENAIGIGDVGAAGNGGGNESTSSGFVYPSIGTAFAGTRPDTPYVMEAGGESPYWRARSSFYEIEGIVFAEFSFVAVDQGALSATLRQVPDSVAPGFRRYVSVEGPAVSAAFQAGFCRDGQGVDRGYFASIQVEGEAFEGCARETGGQWDWSRDLLSRYDAILMCLDEVPEAVGAVDAYSPSETNTAVRVLSQDQSRFECIIINNEMRLASVRELDVTEVHLNEGRTVFLRGVGDVRDECRSYENIMSADGELLGVLAHDLCQNPRAHVLGPLEADGS